MTTQTGIALFNNIAITAVWICFNQWSPWAFDPYPYPFYTTILTVWGIWQNVIIMWRQKKMDAIAARQEEIDRKNSTRMLALMEAQQKADCILIEHAKAAHARDLASVDRDAKILAALGLDMNDSR